MEAQSFPTSRATAATSRGTVERTRIRRSGLLAAGRFDPLAVAAFAVAVSAAGAARPSLWFDEAATISAGSRSLPELWRLLGNIDAVHGLFYLLMHGWLTVFPATEFWLRLPSCLAVGVAAAGVVVLGRQFSGRTVAVAAGITFAILPRVTWAGIEARSYALTAAGAVWLTVLVVAAVRRNSAAWWGGYAVGLAALAVLNLFTVLIVLPHLLTVSVLAPRPPLVWRWAAWVVGALTVLAPFAMFCRTQIAQVRWISPLHPGTVVDIVYQQYFDRSVAFAVASAVLVLTAVTLRRYAPLDKGTRQLAVVATAWMVLPTLALVGYSAMAAPIYYPRYLCFTSPAAALLLAISMVALVRTRERVTALLVVLAVAATPNYVFKQRGQYAKEGMDFSQIADLVTSHAAPGDCLILDNTVTWLPGPVRPLTAARPAAYAKLVDPGRGVRAADRNWLWDAHVPIWVVAPRVQRCTVLWTVSDRDHTLAAHDAGPGLDPGPRMRRAPAYQVPERMGFHIVERWQFNFAQVTKSTR
jgi:mannosyltransferase